MWSEFKTFLVKQNVLALALAVVMGAAASALVNALVEGLFMPAITPLIGGERWEDFTLPIGTVELRVGSVGGAVLNFVIVAFIAFQFTKVFMRPPKPGAQPATVQCKYCRQAVDPGASRCPFCTSELTPAAS